jgi:hypothetical protein
MSFDELVGAPRIRIAHAPYSLVRALTFVGLKLPIPFIDALAIDSLSALELASR